MAVPMRPRRRGPLRLLDPAPIWVQSAARIAAALIVVVTVGYGALAASASSLPNSPLYPVKVLVEDFAIAFAPDDQKPDLLVHQANRRLDEVEALAREGRSVEAERVAEEALRKLESAKVVASLSGNPARLSQAIEMTENRARTTETAIDRSKPPTEPRVSRSRPPEGELVFPVPPTRADPEGTAPLAAGEDKVSPSVESLAPPPSPAELEPIAGLPAALSGAPAAVAAAPSTSPARQVSAPSAGAVLAIESAESLAPTPTRGAVSAPRSTVVPVGGAGSAATPTPTVAPAQSPTRTSTPQVSPAGGSAGAPTGGFTVLPQARSRSTSPSESEAGRPPR